MFGILIPRRENDAPTPKLPEDLTAARQKAQRAEIAGVLGNARQHGFSANDYLTGPDETPLDGQLLLYANHRRYGRNNPGTYEAPQTLSAEELSELTSGGIEVGLQTLDPPFAGYRNLQLALTRAWQRAETDMSALDEVREIETAMEQWRWLPRTFPNGAILVNLPEFRLQAVDETGQVALEMPVIVGQRRHPTPVFAGNLQYVVFGPYWNVPASILANEIIPDIVKDRTYLQRNSYEVLDAGGTVVSKGSVSGEVLAGLRSGEFRVRQVPGAKNALGTVKFMFPNQHHVYLHDTPNHVLFAKADRALSHGCIRVSDPQALAEWVLRGQPEWTPEHIAHSRKQTKQVQVNLPRAIPVYMLYNTVSADADGNLTRWADLYGLGR